MKFVMLVEGDTEREVLADFLKRWLDPQLNTKVGISIVRLQGNASFLRKFAAKAKMHLEGPRKDEIIAVIGLLDLYGLDIFPSHCKTADERYDWGVSHLERTVGQKDFRMFFAVHELEAWILSQSELLPSEVQKAIRKHVTKPEEVDCDEPPAKLLNHVYLARTGKSYKKVTMGKQLFGRLDPAIVATKCPHFRILLQELLKLAKSAGL